MERLTAVAALVCAALVASCGKPAPPSAVSPPVPSPSAVTGGAEELGEAEPSAAEAPPGEGLSASCTKLIVCCDAWVRTTPTARVGCDAQRNAFRAAKTPEARAGLEELCADALAAWAQLPNIPDACK